MKLINRNNKRKVGSILIIIFLVSAGLFLIIPQTPQIYKIDAASAWTQTTDVDFYTGTLVNVEIEGSGPNASLSLESSDYDLLIGALDGVSYAYNNTGTAASPKWTAKPNWNLPDVGDKATPAFADLDDDGDNDLLVGNYDGNSYAYENIGTTYSPLWTTRSNWNAPDIGWAAKPALADLDDDGDYDLLIGEDWGTTKGYNNTGNASNPKWTAKSSWDAPDIGLAAKPAIADLDNDGDYDLLIGASDGVSYAYVNIGTTSKPMWSDKSTWNGPYAYNHAAPALTDLDDDGDYDLLIGTGFGESFAYENTGGPSSPTWTYKRNWNAPDVGDWAVPAFADLDLDKSSGTFISESHDFGFHPVNLKTISWKPTTQPNGTDLKIQLATNNDGSTWEFVGPDGTSNTYYTDPVGEQIWSDHDGDRLLKYKAYFSTTTSRFKPILDDVKINYNSIPSVPKLIGPINNTMTNDNTPIFNWTCNDLDGIQTSFQVLIDDDIQFGSVEFNYTEYNSQNQSWEFPKNTNYTEIPDGTWYWRVRVRDDDDDWSEYSPVGTFIIDTQSPASEITYPIKNSFYNYVETISGTASDTQGGTGIKRVEILIKRLSDNNCWDGSAWDTKENWLWAYGTTNWWFDSVNIDWTSDNQYLVQSRAVDNASNFGHVSDYVVFSFDSDKPTSEISCPSNNICVNNLENINGIATDVGGAGIEKVEISIKNLNLTTYWDGKSWVKNEKWLIVSDTEVWSYDSSNIKWITDNEYHIISCACDKAGNIEFPGAKNIFMYDDQPPTPSISINNGDDYTTSTSVSLSLQVEDSSSGVSLMSLSTDGIEWSEWEPFISTKAFELSNEDGEKRVYFRVQDSAGNIAEQIFDSIILDSTPPEASVIINEDEIYTNYRIVTLDLSATDSLSGVNEVAFSTDGITWSSGEPFLSVKSMTLSAGDGKKNIYFRVQDLAGNIEVATDTIILDTAPPSSLRISINLGAGETNSTSVYLELSAVDDTSGVFEMSFSSDGNNWDAWENYSKSKTYTLTSGDGTKIIYFKVKDRAGNIAKPISDTIVLKATPLVSPHEPEKSFSPLIFLIILLPIIILVVIVLIFFILKRKNKDEQELPQMRVTTIKPKASTNELKTQDQGAKSPIIIEQPETTVTAISQPTPSKSSSLKTPISKVPTTKVEPEIEPISTEIKNLAKRGSQAYGEGRYEEAIIIWQQILEKEPDKHPKIEIAIKDAMDKMKDRI